MAALPYMQFYVADYLADTAHLDAEENGAYLLLIFNYWQTGKPIPKSRLQKIARVSSDRWASVEQALSEFFVEVDGFWKHDRIEADLATVSEAQEQRMKAGKASAEARKRAAQAEKKKEISGKSTPDERPLNDRSTNKEEIREDKTRDKEKDTCASVDAQSDQEPPAKSPAKKKPEIDYSSWPDIPDDQILKDWLQSRKKAKATHSQTAINAIGKELRKAVDMGYTVNQCGEEAATRGWRGFKAEWMQNSVQPANRNGVVPGGNVTKFPGRPSVDDHNREVAMRWASGGDFYDQE